MYESIVENRKVFKRNKILNLIRNNDRCSRYDIKKLTSYSMATVLTVIDELIDNGFLYEVESSDNKVGRKPTWLRINPDYGYFVGVEFHASQVNCAALDFLGRIVHQSSLPIGREEDATAVLEKAARLIEGAAAAQDKPPLGIGLGIPGYYDAEEGVGREYKLIRGWRDVAVRAFIEQRFMTPCLIENNVASMAVGYQYFYMPGEAAGDFLFVSVRSGVRVVSVADNMLYLCNKGYAGQLGHVRVREGGSRMCLCGRRGCLNTEVADTGLKQKILEDVSAGRMRALVEMAGGRAEEITVARFLDAALTGDAESIELLRETAGYLGQALGMMTDILAPSRIILYGELARGGEMLSDALLQAIHANAMPVNTRHLQLTLCPPDERLGACGAARLMMQKQFEFLKETV